MQNEIELEYINTVNVLADSLTTSILGVQMSKFTKFNFQKIIILNCI